MSTLREPLGRRVREVTYLIHSHLVPRKIQAKNRRESGEPSPVNIPRRTPA